MEKENIVSKIKELIVTRLELEDVSPEEINTNAPLFVEGLGLDSIDALELGMAIKKEFNVSFSKDPKDNKKVFASVNSLADFIIASQS